MDKTLRFATREIKEKEGMLFTGEAPVRDYAREGLLGEGVEPGRCTVRLEFSIGGSNILLEARVEGRWTLPCSRCLSPHEAAFGAEFEETYPASIETIDVGEEVRQAVGLQVPSRSLCREDCKGLCPSCGADLNAGTCRCAEPRRGKI